MYIRLYIALTWFVLCHSLRRLPYPHTSYTVTSLVTNDILNLPKIDPKTPAKYTNIPSLLDNLKLGGKISKWGTTNLDYRVISEIELFQVTRNSLSTNDLLQDILKATELPTPMDGKTIGGAFFLVVMASVVVPLLPIPHTVQNILLSFSIALPFVLLILSITVPEFFLNLKREKIAPEVERDRIVYHEAGHFLVGYLCGVFIQSYDVSGEKGAGTLIVLEDGTTLKAKSAHLMVTAMAGVVAEILRFGNCKGGIEDIPVVYEIMRIEKIKARDRRGVLRWALLKALSLLKIYRDELDEVAFGMKSNKEVNDLIVEIENCQPESIPTLPSSTSSSMPLNNPDNVDIQNLY